MQNYSSRHSGTMDIDYLTREIQIVINAISRALRYPAQQMFCLRAITAVIPTIYLKGGNRQVDKLLRSEDHEFLNTITKFVTTQRSEAQSRALIQQLFRCDCDTTNHCIESFHHCAWYGNEADGLFLALEGQIFRVLTGIVSNLPQDRLDKLSSGSQSRRWPTKVTDLMPNGEGATVDALLSHGMKGRLTYSLTTLSLYYRHIPSTLEYAIGRGSRYSPITYNLDIAIVYFESASDGDFTGSVYSEHIQRIMDVHNYLSGINKVFTSGQLGKDPLNRLKHVLGTNARSSYDKVVRLLNIFASTSLPALEPECFHVVRGIAVTLWTHIPALTIRSSSLVPHPLISDSQDDADFIRNGPDPYFLLHGMIRYYLERKDCSNPECSATQRNAKRAFSYCTGCRCMKYCSKECQKECWILSYAPHKQICKRLLPLRQMAVDADKKAQKTNRASDSLRMDTFKKLATISGVSRDGAKDVYQEMRKVFEKDIKIDRPTPTQYGLVD